jgi:hypothetical protein
MRIALMFVATGLVALGLWLMASGFVVTGPAEGATDVQIAAPSHPTAGPIALGLALLAGGGLLFIMLLRRR